MKPRMDTDERRIEERRRAVFRWRWGRLAYRSPRLGRWHKIKLGGRFWRPIGLGFYWAHPTTKKFRQWLAE